MKNGFRREDRRIPIRRPPSRRRQIRRAKNSRNEKGKRGTVMSEQRIDDTMLPEDAASNIEDTPPPQPLGRSKKGRAAQHQPQDADTLPSADLGLGQSSFGGGLLGLSDEHDDGGPSVVIPSDEDMPERPRRRRRRTRDPELEEDETSAASAAAATLGRRSGAVRRQRAPALRFPKVSPPERESRPAARPPWFRPPTLPGQRR